MIFPSYYLQFLHMNSSLLCFLYVGPLKVASLSCFKGAVFRVELKR